MPHGLSTSDLEPFLRKEAPLLFRNWDELQRLYEGNYEQFFERPEVVQLIAEAQEAIKRAMASFRLPTEIDAWVRDDSYYMVRSSGAEDGKKTANAGGNLSCKYVAKKEIAARQGKS